MKTIWKTIPNFSNYESSNTGFLRSINYKRSGKKVILKPSESRGYLKTMLKRDDNKYKSWNVHNFIMLSFKGPKQKGQEVNHIDGNKLNNNINNLEYCTRSENMKHAFDNGLATPKKGELNPSSKLTSDDVKEIRAYVKSKKDQGIRFYGRKKLAEKYNISESHIKDIVSKRRDIWS